MSGYSLVIDTSKCTACRGCQVACKEWNQLPATKTKNVGSHQNPQDFSFETYKLVRYSEGSSGNGKPFWLFMSDQCRHCLSPGCMGSVENDEIIQDEKTGAVIYTPKTKSLNYKTVRDDCPFDIPRQDPKTKVLAKCTLCNDRLKSGMIPACAKACPTGAITFGERDKMLAACKERVAELKKTFPKAAALNAEDVRVIFIVKDDPAKYWKFAAGK